MRVGEISANKDVRRLCASTLGVEAVVIALFIPVAIKVSDVEPVTAGLVGGVLAVGCVVLCGLLRHPWALVASGLLQVAAIVTGVLTPMMYFLGAVFAGLWVWAIVMPMRYERRMSHDSAQGNSPNHTS